MLRSGLTLAVVFINTAAHAELSANVGVTSNYVAKGLTQTDNRPAIQGGLDYLHASGLYVGTLGSTVDKGIEVDVYAGNSGEFKNFVYDIGYMTYNYTDKTFSEKTTEAYIGGKYKIASLYYSIGEYGDIDYTYLDLGAEFDLPDIAKLKLHYGLLKFDIAEDDFYDYKITISRDLYGYVLSLSYTAENLKDEKHVFVTVSKDFEL